MDGEASGNNDKGKASTGRANLGSYARSLSLLIKRSKEWRLEGTHRFDEQDPNEGIWFVFLVDGNPGIATSHSTNRIVSFGNDD